MELLFSMTLIINEQELKRKGNLVLFEYPPSTDIVKYGNYVIRDTSKKTYFSTVQISLYTFPTFDIGFDACKILSELEDICIYLFDCKFEDPCYCVGDISIHHIGNLLFITNKSRTLVNRYNVDNNLIDNVVNHPALQQYRINHSKPINPAMFE